MKRTPLKKQSEAKKAKLKEEREETKKMWMFFLEIWVERPHWCVVCNAPLYGQPVSAFFDHLLEKHLYPEYKFEKWNIAVVCLNCHSSKSNGWPKEKHLEMMEEARKFAMQNTY